ncbi:MAG: CCA tRNA nucleotidyltransferase [Bacteroidales bacterium]|nr:CCA tRNA nucleotidyltransferase [Candidatus Liminaster caballi]
MNKFEKTLRFISDKITPDSPFYGRIYLVGGCVRDELLGERYTDLDLLVDMPNGQKAFVEHMCAEYPETCKGPFYYQRYGTTAMDVIIDGSLTLVECVEPHVEAYAEDGVTLLETRFCSLEEDATRRDYTCNALYKNLSTGEVLDPTGHGVEDLRNGLLRTPSEPNMIFRQDPVRMLRGIRFKHQKGFRIDQSAWDAILAQNDEMRVSAPKRLRDELNKLLKARTFGEGIHDMLSCGLLAYVMPGLDHCLHDREPIAKGDGRTTIWQHTRTALAVQCREHPHTDAVMRLTVLMSDIYDRYGQEMVTRILVASQIGREKISTIVNLLRMYRRFCSFFENGSYVERPRVLPHFIIALAGRKDDFRRMVRALNHGLAPEYQLPYQLLYDKPSQQQMSQEQIKRARNNRRNIKRREQRKRQRRRASATA